ncbi:hypothetical protein [Streptomyces sp. AC558_RSS880]|uniref:hypothetical protein n=1 Tax=Streptomyces sp. AC558_RSS880 TaxID=2823687 RepID=UPI001C2182F9|nr:hypothetical protein [Streptomyces sp. AC558_RSS880]
MRRTARSLSLAAATGAALAALAPAAFAGTVLDDGASWGSASHSPCPEPGEHEWEPDVPGPAGPEAAVPKSTALDDLDELGTELDAGLDADLDTEFDADPDADLDAELDAELGPEAEIPAPGERESAPTGPGAVEPKALKPKPTESRPTGPEPTESKPTESRTPDPEPTGSKATPCADTPARQGVHAGGGGAFTDSVPALAVGGLLIAGAFGAAAHRVYRDRTTRADG